MEIHTNASYVFVCMKMYALISMLIMHVLTFYATMYTKNLDM